MGVATNKKHTLMTEKIKTIRKRTQGIIQIGEKVKIKALDDEAENELEPEDYFYLKKFENKTGIISERNKSRSGKYAYKVEFTEDSFGYFYSKDLLVIDEE